MASVKSHCVQHMHCLYKVTLLWEQQSRHNVPLMGREGYPCICTQKSRSKIFQDICFLQGRMEMGQGCKIAFLFWGFFHVYYQQWQFSHVKTAVYYTRTKVYALNHVPLAKLDIRRPWAQRYHFLPLIIDYGHKANQALCRLSTTYGMAGQFSCLILSRNSYWTNDFKLSTFYFKILKGGQ